MSTHYFVNHKTRVCQILRGPDHGAEHLENIKKVLKDGYVEVSGPDEIDAFRAETATAIAAGWNPRGRVSYSKFLERRAKP